MLYTSAALLANKAVTKTLKPFTKKQFRITILLMEYKKLIDPPASEKVLSALYAFVFTNSLRHKNTTIFSFRGAGHLSQIKYLLRTELPQIASTNRHLFFVLDLEHLSSGMDTLLRSSLQEFLAFFSGSFGLTVLDKIEELLDQPEPLTISSLENLSRNLTYSLDHSITYILDNSHFLFDKTSTAAHDFNVLNTVNPMRINLVFLMDNEIEKTSALQSQHLSSAFFENIVWATTGLLFDAVSIESLFKNQQKWQGFEFSDAYIELAKSLATADPSVAKKLAVAALDDPNFAKSMIELDKTADIYALLGAEWLDYRYKKIIRGLSQESLDFFATLKTNETAEATTAPNPTEYLLKTGLVSKNDSTYKLLNPLFAQFIKANKSKLLDIKFALDVSGLPANLKEKLTAQELLIFTNLFQSRGVLVEKDTIAQLIWGDDWEDLYSDQAIDKTISNIRKKLSDSGSELNLKSLKGKGFILV